jgi:DNA-binding response OmpR family regulator
MPTVLLIEPHADTARIYAETLHRAGFRVETGAPEAEMSRIAPHVVVISVPRMERSLPRVTARGRSVPRIVVSSDASDARRTAEFDCAAVLIRPVMYDDLIKEVRRVLKTTASGEAA